MATNTDTMWANRLSALMPDNFNSNVNSNFTENQNYLSSMMNMIGLTVINSVDNPYNPFTKYTKNVVDNGDQIQQYKVKYISGQKYDPDNVNPFTTTKNSPIAQYSILNDSTQYHERILSYEFAKAFNSDQKLGDFVSSKLDAMYQSDGLDKYTKFKKYMSNTTPLTGGATVANETIAVDATDTMKYAENLIKAMRKYANAKFRQPNTAFNIQGDVALSTDIDIIMKAEDVNLLDEYLKGVYNLDKVRINANIIQIDDFATVTGAPTGTDGLAAIICDARTFAYYPRTPVGGAIYNPAANSYDYYLTIQGDYCWNTFRNCVQLYKGTA